MLLTLLTAIKVGQEGKEAILCRVINEYSSATCTFQ